jgi:hypothetical protein
MFWTSLLVFLVDECKNVLELLLSLSVGAGGEVSCGDSNGLSGVGVN